MSIKDIPEITRKPVSKSRPHGPDYEALLISAEDNHTLLDLTRLANLKGMTINGVISRVVRSFERL